MSVRRLSLLLALLLSSRAAAEAEPDADPDSVPEIAADGPPLIDEPRLEQARGKQRKKKRGEGLTPKISGYLQVFFKKRFDTDETHGREPSLFRIQRMRLAISGRVVDKVRYQVEIDPRAPEVAGVLRDAYLELRHIPHHKIRIGQQKTPWGYENLESSSRLYTVTRSELSEGAGRGLTLRDIGIAIKGRIPVAERWDVEDHVALVNGAGMNTQVDPTTTKNVWGRIGTRYRSPAQTLTVRAGVSFGIGDYVEPEDPGPPVIPPLEVSFKRIGIDVQVDSRWAFVVGEAALASDETSEAPGEPDRTISWYVLAAGKTPWAVGPVVRYDTSNGDGLKRWTMGGYWGAIDARLRAMATYEVFEDDTGPHDHRLLLWTQVRL